ncbi:hypothetical protein K504DRAFT_498548 [Pleomassaria siparia CBS 279.74]|uniref:Uncharacterized protein n=1 Tax=Pleomassaria siparia CBS 279.74 TaxID=1314801 RepID=A0A6G1KMH9_9PLEO|nr:hypothetical protein K504DRAFT_498548 [Pleomassaria siparia CBS 279.74]
MKNLQLMESLLMSSSVSHDSWFSRTFFSDPFLSLTIPRAQAARPGEPAAIPMLSQLTLIQFCSFFGLFFMAAIRYSEHGQDPPFTERQPQNISPVLSIAYPQLPKAHPRCIISHQNPKPLDQTTLDTASYRSGLSVMGVVFHAMIAIV